MWVRPEYLPVNGIIDWLALVYETKVDASQSAVHGGEG